MENKIETKNDVIRLRIEKNVKEEFTELLKRQGDKPSQWLYRAIIRYINEQKTGQ